MCLYLSPDLLLGFCGRALNGRFSIQNSRNFPVRYIDRKNAAKETVAKAVETSFYPKLPLGNGCERPRGIGVKRMSKFERHVLCEVELDAIHPGRADFVEVRKRWRERFELVVNQVHHHFNRDGGNIIVGCNRNGLAVGFRSDGYYSRCRGFESLDKSLAAEFHAALLQVGYPRIQPNIVGRSVEQAVEATIAHQTKQQLQERITDRPRAAFLSTHGHQRAR